jgi:outer membrane protein OmpA-like peptidoglycan-associated protein
MGTLRLITASFALLSLARGALADEGDAKPDEERRSIEAGLFVGGFFPSDAHEFYDSRVTSPKELEAIDLEVGVRAAYFPVAPLGIEVEGLAIPTKTAGQSGDVILYGARGHVILQYPGRVVPFILAGGGAIRVSSRNEVLGRDTDALAHAGLGLKFRVTRSVGLRLDGRLLRGPEALRDDGTNHYEVTLGLAATPRFRKRVKPKPETPPDPDRDGIIGDTDLCPDEPGAPPDGCPPKDSDGDGVLDREDACPEEAETDNGWEDEDGCPDEIPDSDGDGLDDLADECKDQAEDADGYEDEDGCPDPDNDDDGVLDAEDRCPTVAGPVENRGCPDTDRDGDGVVDRLDNCPDEPGTAENRGCKKKQLVALSHTKLIILGQVHFRTGKARIRSRSRRLLKNVARVLVAHPEIKKIRVEGHTDNVGKARTNMTLSQNRAEAVVTYLVNEGVPTDRLEAVGFGEERPIEDNATLEGRAANRRVEFNILE